MQDFTDLITFDEVLEAFEAGEPLFYQSGEMDDEDIDWENVEIVSDIQMGAIRNNIVMSVYGASAGAAYDICESEDYYFSQHDRCSYVFSIMKHKNGKEHVAKMIEEAADQIFEAMYNKGATRWANIILDGYERGIFTQIYGVYYFPLDDSFQKFLETIDADQFTFPLTDAAWEIVKCNLAHIGEESINGHIFKSVFKTTYFGNCGSYSHLMDTKGGLKHVGNVYVKSLDKSLNILGGVLVTPDLLEKVQKR